MSEASRHPLDLNPALCESESQNPSLPTLFELRACLNLQLVSAEALAQKSPNPLNTSRVPDILR